MTLPPLLPPAVAFRASRTGRGYLFDLRYSQIPSGSACLSGVTGPVSGSWRMFREAGLGPCQFRPRVVDGDAAGHIDEGNPGSDAQPSPGQCNLGCNLHPDSAAVTRTGQHFPSLPLSRPLEDCEGCPVLAGVRNLGLDESQRRCSDLHCNFGGRSSRAASSGCMCAEPGPLKPGCADRTIRRAEWQALAECVARGGEHAPDTPKSKRALRFSSLADPMPRSLPALPGRQAVPP